ncbi:3716_t:CDS:2, partial [Gigaspora margarita]
MFQDKFSNEMKFNSKKLNEEENSLSKEFWAEFANKAIHSAFEQKPVFKGLCHIMLQAAKHEEQDK